MQADSDPRPVDADTTSDPAHNEEEGHDWSGEGGATTEGPATDVDDGEITDDGTAPSEDD